MSLHFILGRAGTGKTRYCLDSIRRELLADPEGPPLILLVPEQATFQMERALVTAPDLRGSIRAQVLSFRRLAWRVGQEVGGLTRPYISDLAQHMILRRLLERHEGELQILHRGAWRQPGFVAELAAALQELKRYRLSPADLRQVSTSLQAQDRHSPLALKLHDLALLWEEMEKALAPRFLDPEDTLELLAANLLQAPSLRGAEIWVDGFIGFTPQEYAVLESLLKVCRCVHIALCLDSRELQKPVLEGDPFYPTRETLARLKDLVHRLEVPVDPPAVLDKEVPYRFLLAGELAHLERNFFHPAAPAWEGPVNHVRLLAATDRRAEVEGVAREIIHLCRTRCYRWRENALLVRDLELYRDLIANVFADYDIPFFIDAKRPLIQHPLVELVRAALETVAQNWAYDPLFRFLKTDLVPMSREEVDILENYVLAHGIRGSRWLDGRPWTYRRRYTLDEETATAEDSSDLERINDLRDKVVTFLGPLDRALRQARNCREMTLALYNLLLRLKVPEQLESWRSRAMAVGLWDEAQEHAQIWETVVQTLEQLVEILGEEALTLDEYTKVLTAGLEGQRLGLIPQGLDQVLVTSLDRSRHPEVRAAFLLGANEGIFPARPAALGFFKDAEREELEQKGLNLAPGSTRRLLDEQHLVYIALTRSREFLYLSYALADEEGRALRPSPVIGRLKALLPGLRETFLGAEPDLQGASPLNLIARPAPALSHLAGRLRQLVAGRTPDPVWFEVYNWARQHPLYRQHLEKIITAIFYANREEPLQPEVSRALYGETLKTSVSRLERFRACPFAHFLGDGLRLKERQRYKLVPPDLGQFFHAALKELAETLEREQLDWSRLEVGQCQQLCREIVAELAPRLQNEILLSTARYRYLTRKLEQTLERAAAVLAKEARYSTFRPAGLEVAFGPRGQLPPLRITMPGGQVLEISGRIDRVDVAPGQQGLWVRIIDYKSSSTDLKLAEVYWGLKLQLLTYLEVLLTHGQDLLGQPCLPAAVLYFPVINPLVRSSGPSQDRDIEEELLKKFKMKGLLLGDPGALSLMDNRWPQPSPLLPGSKSSILSPEQFALLRQHMRRILEDTGRQILEGVISISPYRRKGSSPCPHCPYRQVCGFDPLLPGNSYRFLHDPDIQTIWDELRENLNPPTSK